MMNKLKRENVSQPYEFTAVIVAISKAGNRGDTSIVYARRVDKDHNGDGQPFRLRHSWNPSRNDARYIWKNQKLRTSNIELGTIVPVKELGLECFVFTESDSKFEPRVQDITKILMDFELGNDAFRSVKEAFPKSQQHEVANDIPKLKHPLPIPESSFRFVSVKQLYKQDERLIFLTESGELFNLKLNCRKHKSTCHKTEELFAPGVNMEDICYGGNKESKEEEEDGGEDENEDDEEEKEEEEERGDEDQRGVGILVLIRFAPEMDESGFGWAVVEGVLSRYMSKIISRDEEPDVKILNKNDDVVNVEGNILFDTGNDSKTLITRELAEELELDIKELSEPITLKAPGNNDVSVTHDVELPILIRWHLVSGIRAHIGKPASGVDLLIGMDIIKRLYARGYTIGE